jgi:hypothetical protein
MSVEQIIICILLVVIFYLYYLYKKALSANKEDSSMYYFNSTGRPSGNNPSSTFKEKEPKEEEMENEEEEDEKEYIYEDPNFNLAPILPSKTMKGKVVGEFGDAIYGNEKRYYKDLYYGRVSHGAKIELTDRRVYKNQFELNIIKIRVIKNEWGSEEGRIGWVGLEDTSFRDKFDPESRTIIE